MALIATVAEEAKKIAVKMMMWKSPPQSEGDCYDWRNVEPNQLIQSSTKNLGYKSTPLNTPALQKKLFLHEFYLIQSAF